MKANEIISEVFNTIGTPAEVAAELRAVAEHYTKMYMTAKAGEEAATGGPTYAAPFTAGVVLDDLCTLNQIADIIEGKQ